MIDAHHIIQRKAMGQAAHPPCISCLCMIGPVVNGIAPKLAGSGESIRRTTCHYRGISLLIKAEQLRVTPGIRTVKSYVDRNVADDPDLLVIGVLLQRLPLPVKKELLKFIETNLLFQHLSVMLHGSRSAKADILLPLYVRLSVERSLHRTVKGIVRKPFLLFLYKLLQCSPFLVVSSLCPLSGRMQCVGAIVIGSLQKTIAAGVNSGIIDISFLVSPVTGLYFFLCKVSSLHQLL